MATIIPRPDEHVLTIMRRCRGYYVCPKNKQGVRMGPLAGYAGTYGPDKKQYVGDTYLNFAMAERHGPVLEHFAKRLLKRWDFSDTDVFIGAPEGGKALATVLACLAGAEYIFPEKKVTALATSAGREKSELVFNRHQPEQGAVNWMVEDTINNMSTPDKLNKLVKIAGIVCFCNRSEHVDSYTLEDGRTIPVVYLMRLAHEQYEQEDPRVADDIAAGNVIWKPKNDWQPFEDAMRLHGAG